MAGYNLANALYRCLGVIDPVVQSVYFVSDSMIQSLEPAVHATFQALKVRLGRRFLVH